ncbi:hypothetical protein ACTXT7_000089 [Hymenolepis weldensis]
MCVILNNDRNPQAYRSQSNGRQGGGRNYWEHEAEHLSTLVTSATRPPPDPESSLRRLHQLADSKQLTITPVKLILREHKYRKELLVTNVTNGDVCECVPLEDIITPIYKESNDPTDSFNNLLMFNVNASPSNKSGPPQHEMHIFQCVSAPAHEIVDALTEIQANSEDDVHMPDQYAEPLTAESNSQNNQEVSENGMDAVLTSQQIREKAMIDSEIVLLNMCFDDIESYVGHIYKLQRARCLNSANSADDNVSVAGFDASSKKKKRRFIFKKRTGSPKNKSRRDMTRVTSNTSIASEVEIPISDDELIDLFEKIKFSIILLSRLQGYVTEPNPPTLTHKLFSMMRQPIDFIRDPVTGEPEMAKKVISPLFPEAAIKLILNSLIEPELSLWRELGNGWCLSKDQWEVHVPTYIPQFKCGFKPQPDQYHYTLFDQPPPRKISTINGMSSRSSRANLNMGQGIQGHDEYLAYLRRKGARVARVTRDFVAESEKEISLKAGEYVEVLNDSLNWNKLRNRRGVEGYAPFTILDYNVV